MLAWGAHLPLIPARRPVVPWQLITGVVLGLLIAQWLEVLPRADEILWADDFRLYRDAAERWLAGGSPYLPWQLAGPYPVTWETQPVMYPPPAFLLFGTFTVIPAPVYWIVPVAVTAWAVWHHRPIPAAWPVLALCLWFPSTQHMLVAGNPGIWIVAALAVATVRGGWAVAVFLKPTLAPFALWGIRRRWWWVTLAAGIGLSALMLPLWAEYVTALRNAQSNGVGYSIDQVPAMLIPVTAWLASSRRASSPAGRG